MDAGLDLSGVVTEECETGNKAREGFNQHTDTQDVKLSCTYQRRVITDRNPLGVQCAFKLFSHRQI